MPKIVDKRKRALQLSQAATRVLAREGFAATRMEDIAKEAGVSKGLLYEYYRSKEDLFFAVCDHLAAQRPRKANGGRRLDSPIASLIQQVAANYDWSPDFIPIMVDYWGKILKGTAEQRRKYITHVDKFYAERRREIRDILASYSSRGELQLSLNPAVLANLVIACVEGIHMQEFLCSRGAGKAEVLSMLGEIILRTRISRGARAGTAGRVGRARF
jgi:AcrR family transcriptional regulator